MKQSKKDALKTLRDAELTEFMMFTSNVIDPIVHIAACNIFQHLIKMLERAPLDELEAED